MRPPVSRSANVANELYCVWLEMAIAWRVHVEPAWGKLPITNIIFTDVQAWVTGLSVGDAKAKPKI